MTLARYRGTLQDAFFVHKKPVRLMSMSDRALSSERERVNHDVVPALICGNL